MRERWRITKRQFGQNVITVVLTYSFYKYLKNCDYEGHRKNHALYVNDE